MNDFVFLERLPFGVQLTINNLYVTKLGHVLLMISII